MGGRRPRGQTDKIPRSETVHQPDEGRPRGGGGDGRPRGGGGEGWPRGGELRGVIGRGAPHALLSRRQIQRWDGGEGEGHRVGGGEGTPPPCEVAARGDGEPSASRKVGRGGRVATCNPEPTGVVVTVSSNSAGAHVATTDTKRVQGAGWVHAASVSSPPTIWITSPGPSAECLRVVEAAGAESPSAAHEKAAGAGPMGLMGARGGRVH